MKGKLFLFLLLILLVGCTPKAYTDNLAAGKEEIEKQNYSEAIEAFRIANSNKETSEIKLLLTQTNYVEESITAFNEGNFEASIQTAKKIINEESNIETIQALKNRAESLINESEKAIKQREYFQTSLVRGTTLLEKQNFDEAFKVFEELSANKDISEKEYYIGLRNEITKLMNDTFNQKKLFIEEQERIQLEEERKKR